jgi:hypothetical protein
VRLPPSSSGPYVAPFGRQRLLGSLQLGLCLLKLFGQLRHVFVKRGDYFLSLLVSGSDLRHLLSVCRLHLADLLEQAGLEVMVSIIHFVEQFVECGRTTVAAETGDVRVCDEVRRGVGYEMRSQCETYCCIDYIAYQVCCCGRRRRHHLLQRLQRERYPDRRRGSTT